MVNDGYSCMYKYKYPIFVCTCEQNVATNWQHSQIFFCSEKKMIKQGHDAIHNNIYMKHHDVGESLLISVWYNEPMKSVRGAQTNAAAAVVPLHTHTFDLNFPFCT